MLLNLSVSGIAFVGADVGGYSDMPSGELYSRWLQAAALTPFLRAHSENNLPDKEPWEYGLDFEKINRASIELRYQLLPYLYTLFREHEQTGKPVMRPLWFEYPQDSKNYLIDDQYLVGHDLLVAPVVKENQRTRSIYFPMGDNWRDWTTGKFYKGGTTVEVEAPLEKLPVFVRVGAVLPTQPTIQQTGQMTNAPLTLNVSPGINPGKIENTTIFQDAGDGFEYRSDAWREIAIKHQKGLLLINNSGNLTNAQKIKFIKALGIERKPKEIRVDDKPLTNFVFDQDAKQLFITLSSDHVRKIELLF
jgi:alpha-glucosidase